MSIILSIMYFDTCISPLFRLVKGKLTELYSINLNINNIDNIVNNICLPANTLSFFEFVRGTLYKFVEKQNCRVW